MSPAAAISDKTWDALIERALDVRQRAHAPYSHYKVGAALLAEDGSLVGGCNVENSSYGASLCAERVAVCAAVASGQRAFRALVVALEDARSAVPCGLCLQVLSELCDDLPLLIVDPGGTRERTTLRRLMPTPFRL